LIPSKTAAWEGDVAYFFIHLDFSLVTPLATFDDAHRPLGERSFEQRRKSLASLMTEVERRGARGLVSALADTSEALWHADAPDQGRSIAELLRSYAAYYITSSTWSTLIAPERTRRAV
jgi:hypothetical protein